MSEALETLVAELLEEVRQLRADLKRRSARELEAGGRIPPGSSARAAGGSGAVFPNYGRSKGQPVAGASRQDLEYYAQGCRRTLADPGKARFHDKERVLLAAIEAELARQGGGRGYEDGPAPEPPQRCSSR